jgi:hypothetical protein
MPETENEIWTKSPEQPGYYKAVPFECQLGQLVLRDLATRYPNFKPKYIQQDHINDESPEMVSVYSIGPDDISVEIFEDNDSLRFQEYHKDIAGALYVLKRGELTFIKGSTFFDFATMNQPQVRPDLREFHKLYQQLKVAEPEMVTLIEGFANTYEQKLAEYNGIYEPLALRELLWYFAKSMNADSHET